MGALGPFALGAELSAPVIEEKQAMSMTTDVQTNYRITTYHGSWKASADCQPELEACKCTLQHTNVEFASISSRLPYDVFALPSGKPDVLCLHAWVTPEEFAAFCKPESAAIIGEWLKALKMPDSQPSSSSAEPGANAKRLSSIDTIKNSLSMC